MVQMAGGTVRTVRVNHLIGHTHSLQLTTQLVVGLCLPVVVKVLRAPYQYQTWRAPLGWKHKAVVAVRHEGLICKGLLQG